MVIEEATLASISCLTRERKMEDVNVFKRKVLSLFFSKASPNKRGKRKKEANSNTTYRLPSSGYYSEPKATSYQCPESSRVELVD